MTRNEFFVRNILLGLSFFVVGVCLFMAWTHIVAIHRRRHVWDVWFLMIYIGIANTVALVAQALWGVGGVPVNWKTASYAIGLALIFVGSLGVAYSSGQRNKRQDDVGHPRQMGEEH